MLAPKSSLHRTVLNFRSRPERQIGICLSRANNHLRRSIHISTSASKLRICNNLNRTHGSPLARHASSFNDLPSTKETSKQNFPNVANTSQLDWNTFFQLRKKRLWYEQLLSVGAGFGGVVAGIQLLMHSELDTFLSATQIPLDPFLSLGLTTFICGGLGWLLGPVVGRALFNLQTRGLRSQIDEREKEFFKRVRRHRVDPSTSSMANPVPDYYGEKVSSVQGYRQWLKDCRAFNKKRSIYLK